jgi:DNA-binding LacI/PurR family transcriptional regulator
MTRSSGILSGSPRDHAIQSLRGLIERSGLTLGDRLPAESKLAAQFAVSRMTVRKALDALEREGLVRRERNLGCVYAAKSRTNSGLLSRTVALVTDHGQPTNGKLFSGGSPAIVSGMIARLERDNFNFLRVAPRVEDGLWMNDLIAAGTPGVIVSCWTQPIDWQVEVLNRFAASGLPLATWGESDEFKPYDRVASDHVSGTIQLVHALADAGCRNVLRLWTVPAERPWIRAHNDGYDKAVAERRLNALPAVYVEGLPEREQESEANFRLRVRYVAGYLAEHLHKTPAIDAVMVGTDCETLVVLGALRLVGREDVRVTGYDNQWYDAPERQWEPGIPFASIDKNNHRLGEELAGLLLERITGKLPSAPQQRMLEQRLVLSERIPAARH